MKRFSILLILFIAAGLPVLGQSPICAYLPDATCTSEDTPRAIDETCDIQPVLNCEFFSDGFFCRESMELVCTPPGNPGDGGCGGDPYSVFFMGRCFPTH